MQVTNWFEYLIEFIIYLIHKLMNIESKIRLISNSNKISWWLGTFFFNDSKQCSLILRHVHMLNEDMMQFQTRVITSVFFHITYCSDFWLEFSFENENKTLSYDNKQEIGGKKPNSLPWILISSPALKSVWVVNKNFTSRCKQATSAFVSKTIVNQQ